MTIRELIGTHPTPTSVDRDLLVRCVEECVDCAAVCTGCSDACLAEPDVAELVRCIRLCLDCADVCGTTARVVTRQTEAEHAVLRRVVEANRFGYRLGQCGAAGGHRRRVVNGGGRQWPRMADGRGTTNSCWPWPAL